MNRELTEKEIRILPDFIANQIAAGEVVQRPENVVKELVENSIDAGADSIAVVVRGAGKNLIHVFDNGSGMSHDNLVLATKRHATSKIRSSEDLERIMTFGFRGEALASISAVASIEIRTKRQDDELGWKLIAEPLQEDKIEPANTDNGTQIFVRNLFYNVPARRKFLRANLTEFRYISDTMIKFVLANPDIRFTFYDEDSLIFDVKADSLINRIVKVLGNYEQESFMEVDYQGELLRVSGYVGLPHYAKSGAGQYFFLNKRAIENKSLAHAVYSAFEHLLEKNQKPVFILNLEIDPEKVDINVHPQKHEVKFEDERHVYATIRKAVSLGLEKNNLTPGVVFKEQESMSPFIKMPDANEGDFLLVNKITGEIVQSTQQDRRFQMGNNPSSGGRLDFFSQPSRGESSGSSQSQGFSINAYEHIFGKSGESSSSPLPNEYEAKKEVLFLQIHNKYILMQNDRGVLIIDQHNAHERVLYEKAIKAMNKELAYSQTLLFPVPVKLSPSEMTLFDELVKELSDLGFVFEKIENGVELLAVPLDIESGMEHDALTDILHEYEERASISHSSKRDAVAASYSCKAAIKTGKKLSQEEMKTLSEKLLSCEMPYVCPHGRPVILEFSLPELDKQFGRTS